MKRIMFLILTVILISVVGCSNKNETDNKDTKDEPQVETDESENSEEQQLETEQSEGELSEDNSTVDEDVKEDEPLTPQYQISQETWSVVPLEEGINENVVLLTIDDAPDKYALEMAKTLKELNVPAIFFVNGHFLDTDEEKVRLKEIYDMGFTIGNHTYHHQNLQEIEGDTAKQKEEIVSLSDVVEEIIGERPKFFRAPNGENTDFSKQLVKDEGMVLMNWSYGYDYFEPYMDAEKLTKAMITGEGPEVGVPYSLLKSGANLLMHDREWTNKALPDIVEGLRAQGYEFVDPKLIQTP